MLPRIEEVGQFERHSALPGLLATISRDLLAALPSALEQVIESSLAQLGNALGAEQGAIFHCNPQGVQRLEQSWRAKPLEHIPGIEAQALPKDWMIRLRRLQPVIVADLSTDYTAWQAAQGRPPRSAIITPIQDATGLQGMVGFFTLGAARAWSLEEHQAAQLFGDLVVLAQRNHQTLEKLREAELRWKFALESSQQGVWDWDASTDEVFFSTRWMNSGFSSLGLFLGVVGVLLADSNWAIQFRIGARTLAPG